MYKSKMWMFNRLIMLSIIVAMCSCANTAMSREVIKQPQIQKKHTLRKLVVKRALQDDVSSEMYKIQLIESSVFQKSIRNNTKIVVKRYPFSVGRKLDEFIIGAITVPFTPLAIVGGIVNDDPDLVFYPLSMIWPFRNFRPEKAGLLSGPVTPEVTTKIVKGNWQNIGQKKKISVLKNARFKLQVNGKQARFHTDKNGIATINLSNLPGVKENNSSVDIRIVVNSKLKTNHRITPQRLLVARRSSQIFVPKQDTQEETFEDNISENLETDLSENTPISKEKVVALNPNTITPSQEIPAKKPMDLIPNKVNSHPGMDRSFLYKGLSHGYWIKKQDGFPIMALPNRSRLVLYGSENLENPNGKTLEMGKEYYVFSFTFSNTNNKNVAVKVGTSPFENAAHGWTYAKDLFLWNTLNRVSATRSFRIYRSHDSCLRGDDSNSLMFKINGDSPYFPVLERKGSIWCIAYPDKNNYLQYGWIQWLSETGLEVEVRAMKHKIDMAINYLAKKVILNATDLEKQYILELRGPLYLLKPKEEMKMSSLVKEKESSRISKARQIEAPVDEEEFQKFHQQVQELGKILTEKEVWQTDDDVIYIPAERD